MLETILKTTSVSKTNYYLIIRHIDTSLMASFPGQPG